MKDGKGIIPWRWDHLLVALIMAAMVSITFLNILSREIFQYSFSFIEEITINLFVFAVIIGTGIAFERGSHLGMVSLYNIFPAGIKKLMIWVHALLGMMLFMVFCLVLINTVYREITVYQTRSPALWIYQWIYYTVTLALSPCIFTGIFRGARSALRELALKEKHGNE